MAKKSVRKSVAKKATRVRKEVVIGDRHHKLFAAKLNGVMRAVGLIGSAERNAIERHWKLWDWLTRQPGFEAAEKKGVHALREWQSELYGSTLDAESKEVVILNRSRRIWTTNPKLEDAKKQPSVIAACGYRTRTKEATKEMDVLRQQIVEGLKALDANRPDPEKRKEERLKKEEERQQVSFETSKKFSELYDVKTNVEAAAEALLHAAMLVKEEHALEEKYGRKIWESERQMIANEFKGKRSTDAAMNVAKGAIIAAAMAAIKSEKVQAALNMTELKAAS